MFVYQKCPLLQMNESASHPIKPNRLENPGNGANGPNVVGFKFCCCCFLCVRVFFYIYFQILYNLNI